MLSVISTGVHTLMNPARRHQNLQLFQVITTVTATACKTKPKQTSPSPNQVQGENRLAWSTVQEQFEKDLQCPVFEITLVTPMTTEAPVQNKEEEQERLMSCPVCFSLHPVERIDEHADNCSMWLLDDSN